jgi:LysM repeat protein
MAKAVTTDFNQLGQEELIIEESREFNFNPNNQAIKYLPNQGIEKSLSYLEENKKNDLAIFDNNKNSDIIKPSGINLENIEIKEKEVNTTERTETIEYEIKSGDTISAIAQKFGLKVNTILWANNLSSFSLIKPGNKLIILPTDGVFHTIKSGETLSRLAQIYNINSQEIAEYNNIKADALKINQKIIIPGGSKISAPARVSPTPAPKPTITQTASTAVSPSIPASGSNKMAWPTEGHRITQYYSWRHTGLDIANKTGTPIYASDSGTIEFSGWSTGYGYNIVINHGGGKKTRYAHLSQMFISVGQRVAIGEHIAAMGSTGWSTGPHIHFEVIINGAKQNPLNYIK